MLNKVIYMLLSIFLLVIQTSYFQEKENLYFCYGTTKTYDVASC